MTASTGRRAYEAEYPPTPRTAWRLGRPPAGGLGITRNPGPPSRHIWHPARPPLRHPGGPGEGGAVTSCGDRRPGNDGPGHRPGRGRPPGRRGRRPGRQAPDPRLAHRASAGRPRGRRRARWEAGLAARNQFERDAYAVLENDVAAGANRLARQGKRASEMEAAMTKEAENREAGS